jgi:hypothetical protein
MSLWHRHATVLRTLVVVVVVLTISAPPCNARDPCLQPFGPCSIWNLPLGADARLVPAKIARRGDETPQLSVDPDVLVLGGERCGAAAAPLTPVVLSSGGGAGRCIAAPASAARPFFTAPIPSEFIVPDCDPRGSCGWPWDDSQNYAAALLDRDQDTVHQIQPFERCTGGGPATAAHPYPSVSLHDDSLNSSFGAHGGSAMSSIGGTLRLGELTPTGGSGPRHALKIELNARNYFYMPCFRFPAQTCDGYQMHEHLRLIAALVLLVSVVGAGCVATTCGFLPAPAPAASDTATALLGGTVSERSL